MRLRKVLLVYFNSWWVPTAIFLVLLVTFTIVALPYRQPLVVLSNILFGCVTGALVGVLCSTGWHFIKKRWKKALVTHNR